MKISAFTFLRNGSILGYPFIQSIQSILPLVDEFIVNVGASEDDTLERIYELQKNTKMGGDKIKIIQSIWCEKMSSKGYVYGQQKMIAQFQCSGDWAFYLEADEVLHEKDLAHIKEAMQTYLNDENVEALAFHYKHFYGNANTYAYSPRWYRTEVRAIKTSIRSYAPDGLFWVVLDKENKKGRYPKAILTQAQIYHYGWIRPEEKMTLKHTKISKYWKGSVDACSYSQIDKKTLNLFEGTHPKVVFQWLQENTLDFGTDRLYKADPSHQLTKREKRHRLLGMLEKLFSIDCSKRHYKLIKKL